MGPKVGGTGSHVTCTPHDGRHIVGTLKVFVALNLYIQRNVSHNTDPFLLRIKYGRLWVNCKRESLRYESCFTLIS